MPTVAKMYTKSEVDDMLKKIATTLNRRGISKSKMWKIIEGKDNGEKKTNRYKSPYLHYLDDFRAGLTSEQRRDITQVAKQGGAAWHLLTTDQKTVYNERAEKSRIEAMNKKAAENAKTPVESNLVESTKLVANELKTSVTEKKEETAKAEVLAKKTSVVVTKGVKGGSKETNKPKSEVVVSEKSDNKKKVLAPTGRKVGGKKPTNGPPPAVATA